MTYMVNQSEAETQIIPVVPNRDENLGVPPQTIIEGPSKISENEDLDWERDHPKPRPS